MTKICIRTVVFVLTIMPMLTPMHSIFAQKNVRKSKVIVYPILEGERISSDYKVSVMGKKIPVYNARIAAADPIRRFKAMDVKDSSGSFYDLASFASFDMEGTVNVAVESQYIIRNAKVLPASARIIPVVKGKALTFKVTTPQNLTIEINGEFFKSLHVFANPLEKDKPNASDTNVIYFGPGIHTITHLKLTDNKTLYIAGGAILKATLAENEKPIGNSKGFNHYLPSIQLEGKNIRVCGRGIIDASKSPLQARSIIYVHGSNINIEGVMLKDAGVWNMPVRQSKNVSIRNVKIIGYRANSDGIDICNSSEVTVEDCFIRTLDDLVVVKTDPKKGPSEHILVKRCVLWNQVAHALSIGAEINENVNDVAFTDCDIIHDIGREWAMRVYHSDVARVSNIRFNNIRVENGKKLISLWIGKSVYTSGTAGGHINGVEFSNITANGTPMTIELKGYNQQSKIENVVLKNIVINGKPLEKNSISQNEFVNNVSVTGSN